MKRWLKWMAAAFTSLLVIIILALILIPVMMDTQQFKPQIEKLLSKPLKRNVTLKGNIDLSLFPGAVLSISDIFVANPEGFTQKHFIKMQSIDLNVKLVPLFSKDIQVKRFVLNKPEIFLEKNTQGTGNWQGIGQQTEKKETPEQKSPQQPLIQAFAIEDFSIVQGRVLWEDSLKKEHKDISDINLQLKDISFENPINISFSALADGHPVSVQGSIGPFGKEIGQQPVVFDLSLKALDQIKTEFKGNISSLIQSPEADIAVQLSQFSPRKILKTLNIPFPVQTASLDTFNKTALTAKIKANADSITLSEGILELDKSKINFFIQAKEFSKPNLNFDFNIDNINTASYMPHSTEKKEANTKLENKQGINYELLEKIIIDGKISIGNLKLPENNINNEVQDFNFKIKGQNSKFNIVLSGKKDHKPFSLNTNLGPITKNNSPLSLSFNALNQIKMDINGNINNLDALPDANLNVKIAQFSPRRLMASLGQPFPVKTKDPDALNSIGFTGNIKGSTQSLSISKGILLLDKSRMNFSFQAKDFEKPDIKFNCKLDSIDLNSYLSPDKDSETVNNAEKKPADYALLRSMNLNGDIHAGSLKISNTSIQNINLKISAKKGIVQIKPLTFNVYEGKISVNSVCNIKKNMPQTSINLNAQNIQAEPLLKDVLDKDFLEGTGKVQLNLNMQGDNPVKIKQTLNGKGNFLFTNGAIKGIDLTAMSQNINSAFGLLGQSASNEPRTDFSELKTIFDIKNGLVSVAKTDFVSPFLRASSIGQADLNREALDFKITPKFVATHKGKGDTRNLAGIMVPVLISGTFDKPVFRPDVKGMIKMIPEETITEIIKDPKKGVDKFIKQKKEALDKILNSDKKKKKDSDKKDTSKSLKDEIGGFLKKLPFGQ